MSSEYSDIRATWDKLGHLFTSINKFRFAIPLRFLYDYFLGDK